MNRLIIIGNGFDLAHKMKTSYYDFVFDYIKGAFLIAEKSNKYDDVLMEIKKETKIIDKTKIETLKNITDFKNYLLNESEFKISTGHASERYSILDKISYQPFSWKIKSKFIEHLFIVCCNCNWVDIENEYYNALKLLLNKSNDTQKTKEISELNNSFKTLIIQLEKYLTEQKPTHLNSEFNQIFWENISKNEVVTLSLEQDVMPTNFLILNFNYTSTVEEYKKDYQKIGAYVNFPVTYIHGQLNKSRNPIIFGFGDEYDNDYSEIEGQKIKGFLDYIKSFWYSKTSNYHNLIRFIESDNYQVTIVGHSCGLSDRTMLKMIFEHQNCKSIKINYYQNGNYNNYTELVQEISRHFTDKGEMRKKIVPFPHSKPMPQVEIPK